MNDIEPINVIAEECLSLDILIREHGTELMQTLMRMMLFEVAQEIARKQVDPHPSLGPE